MINLRNYQQSAVDAIRRAYANKKRAPLLVLPTGGGKTTIFAYVTQQASFKNNCVFLLCHRAELVKQISMTLAKFDVCHQVIAPPVIITQCRNSHYLEFGKAFIAPSKVYVCSVQTLIKRLNTMPTPDLIVCDEAHHLTPDSTWGKVIQSYPKARVLPVTATPCRLDGKGLKDICDDMIIGETMENLIKQGYLCNYRAFCPPNALDLSTVKKTAGDYNKGQLAEAMDKPTITGDAVKHYLKLCNGKRAVAFCVSVAHAEHVAESFNLVGVPSESLDGTLSAEERDARIKRFERGETLVLTSCDVISEGFDLPAIEAAILLRPTQSLSLYLQQVGRALRTFSGKKEAIILDHVGALMRHGLPDMDREWSLDGITKKERKKSDEPDINISTCKSCFGVFLAKQNQCPFCQWVKPTPKGREIEQTEGELTEFDKDQYKLKLKLETRAARDYEALVALGRQRGYKSPEFWARKQLEIREAYRAKSRN